MHFCTGFVAVAGDREQIAFRGLFDPISWPEIEVLRFVHGDDAVTDVKPFVAVDQSHKDEVTRLQLRYSPKTIGEVFPGRAPNFALDAPGDFKPLAGERWKNPINGLTETIGEPEPALIKGKKVPSF